MNSHPGRAKPRYPWNSYGFSEREEQIARCVATGLSNKEIADAFHQRTDRQASRKQYLLKTGAKDRFEVGLWMISQDQER